MHNGDVTFEALNQRIWRLCSSEM